MCGRFLSEKFWIVIEFDRMKNVIILHGMTVGDISDIQEFLPDSEQNWMGWTKKQLEERGYSVTNPFIRYGYKQEYEDWKKEIDKLDIDQDTILIGWSSGGAFWVRWLSENKKRVKKLILVAPAKVAGNSEESQKEIKKLGIYPDWRPQWDRFHDFKCDLGIKDRVEEIVVFISNDADWLVEAAKIYAKELDAELIEIKNQGHFENSRRPSPKFPELLEVILR
jgi:predicted alpha/beta hydrolase family esterase